MAAAEAHIQMVSLSIYRTLLSIYYVLIYFRSGKALEAKLAAAEAPIQMVSFVYS